MGLFRRRSGLPTTEQALTVEYGPAWFFLLPQRILEAVWDGDGRLIVSDGRRLAKVLEQSAPPVGAVELQVNFLHALLMSAQRWTHVSHRNDPSSDLVRCGEVSIAVRELAETTMRQAALRAGGKGEAMAEWWMASAADLVVRCVRFRDGFTMPLLLRELEKYPHLCRTADSPAPWDAPTTAVPLMTQKALPAGSSAPLTGSGSRGAASAGVRVTVHAGSGAMGLATTERARTSAAGGTSGSPGRHAAPLPSPADTPAPGPGHRDTRPLSASMPPPAVTGGPGYGPYPGLVGPPLMPQHTPGSYLVHLAQAASAIVNGVPDGARNADECMQVIARRFGGQYPFATAMRAAMVAIRDGDQETLRELADMTAAAGEEDSPARVLHSLVLAGEKVLYGRVA